MKTGLLGALCAGASLFAVSPSAFADDIEGFYLGVEGGIALSPEEDVVSRDRRVIFRDTKNVGANVAAIVGYDKNRWRMEATARWRVLGYDEAFFRADNFIGIGTGDNIPLDGDQTSFDLGLQAMYNVFSIDDVRVYLGGGIAAQFLEVNELGSNGLLVMDDDAWTVAVHATAQAVKPISDNLELGVGYRLSSGADVSLRTASAFTDYSQAAHDIFAKLTWHFDRKPRKAKPAPSRPAPQPQPAPTARPEPASQPVVRETTPAPVPAPQPEPPAPLPGPFQVFFDHNSSEISSRAQRIINAAARAYRNGEDVRIFASGHTDTSGATGYNQRLSERRAAAVQAALEAAGVSAGHISTNAVGETDPLIETADGVREPQNRRVEITLSRD